MFDFHLNNNLTKKNIDVCPDHWDLACAEHLKIDEDFMRIGDCITYFDQDHFSSCGEQILSQTLKPVLTKLIEENKTN